MAIKKQIVYDQKSRQLCGFVNLGVQEESSTEAKEALVVMLVGLKGRWKMPIAFYFTNGLTAEVQAELIRHCLDTLNTRGFQVNAMTMDGHATNIAMCKLLGSHMTLDGAFCPYVQHEKYRTFIFLDACHMVKLMRNMLQGYGAIESADGQIVWQHISDLHETQDRIGLRLANKLKTDHINFHSQKMKVSLAVQTLSNSVASALQTLKDLNNKRFSDAGQTIEFIKVKASLKFMTYLKNMFKKIKKISNHHNLLLFIKSESLIAEKYITLAFFLES